MLTLVLNAQHRKIGGGDIATIMGAEPLPHGPRPVRRDHGDKAKPPFEDNEHTQPVE